MKDDQSGYSEERKEEKSPIPIFNYISSNKNRIKWGKFSRELIENGSKYPPKSAVRTKNLLGCMFIVISTTI